MNPSIRKFLDNFKIFEEREDYEVVVQSIEKGIYFKGTNLWVLIFAIFIASLGLNVNSTAVIIGAMLISPLMGPIMGIGLGLAINDFELTRLAIRNFLFASLVGLITSSIYFGVTPLNDAHSELLARTSPNFYDVLIAFFGGLAGIVATSSKLKGNVIPGVAIATALMPPLCTGGYGLATGNWAFMVGALYLFFINTVFIALATFLTVKVMNFPVHHSTDKNKDKRTQRIVSLVVMLTLFPSIYLGYEMVQKERFIHNANKFIEAEGNIEGDYLLSKTIDPKKKKIDLIYGGNQISSDQTERMNERLKYYGLSNVNLNVRLGFDVSDKNQEGERMPSLVEKLNQTESDLAILQSQMDSIEAQKLLNLQINEELKAQYSNLNEAYFNAVLTNSGIDSLAKPLYLVILDFKSTPENTDLNKIKSWLNIRLRNENIKLIVQ
jgi:uncharacterized hydrophobic protein (TIGR00271 family)